MKFSAIVPHLNKRGFVTRKLWKGQAVLFFGMDNSARRTLYDGRKSYWNPNLSGMEAEDWIILPYYWEGGSDDWKPFEANDTVLAGLRDAERHTAQKLLAEAHDYLQHMDDEECIEWCKNFKEYRDEPVRNCP